VLVREAAEERSYGKSGRLCIVEMPQSRALCQLDLCGGKGRSALGPRLTFYWRKAEFASPSVNVRSGLFHRQDLPDEV